MSTGIKGLLTTGQAARLLGSSRQHVVDLCDRGDLASVRVGRHRRVPREELDRLLSVGQELTRDQERALWLHAALLSRLVSEPEDVLALGRGNVTRLLQQHPERGVTAHWLRRWVAVLDQGADAVAEVATSRSSIAQELRQNSPFAGVLPPDARAKVLAAFARHWRQDHAAPTG